MEYLIDNKIDKNNYRIIFINLISISFLFPFSNFGKFLLAANLKENCKNCFSTFPIMFFSLSLQIARVLWLPQKLQKGSIFLKGGEKLGLCYV